MERPSAGVSLPAIADTERYAVAGHRAWNARRRTLSVRASLLSGAGAFLTAVSETERYPYAGHRTLDAL